MSPGGRSEQKAALRAEIARIEGLSHSATSFDTKGLPHKAALGSNLDRLLDGGLPRGGLTEVVAAQPGDEVAACGFALGLAIRFAKSSFAPILWVIEDGARRETGAPYAPGLAVHGLDPDRLVIVRTARGADTLWATEEALKCRAVAAVVTDLWRSKTYDLVSSRRLVLAAARSGTPGILVPGAAGKVTTMSSAAQARFEVRAATSPRLRSADDRQPMPGAASFDVRLARIRAGPSGITSFDYEKFWPLVWDHEEACLCDALPLPSSAVSRDRPHRTPAQGRRAA